MYKNDWRRWNCFDRTVWQCVMLCECVCYVVCVCVCVGGWVCVCVCVRWESAVRGCLHNPLYTHTHTDNIALNMTLRGLRQFEREWEERLSFENALYCNPQIKKNTPVDMNTFNFYRSNISCFIWSVSKLRHTLWGPYCVMYIIYLYIWPTQINFTYSARGTALVNKQN